MCLFCNFSEIPRELIQLAKGGEVNLNMEDHRTEDYVKPKASTQSFSGQGHMLGRLVHANIHLSIKWGWGRE